MSEVYLKRYDEALIHFEEAFAFCGNQCTDIVKLEGEFGFGAVFYYSKELEKAREHFTASYHLAKKIGNHRFQSENLLYMGKIANQLNDLLMAEKYWKDAENIAISKSYNILLSQIYKELYQLYSLKKDPVKVIFYQSKYIALKDTLMNEQLVSNIAAIQSRFDERENLKNIKTLEENIVLKNEAIARQQLLNIVLGSAAVLLVIIGILIYRLYALRSKSNKQLDDKVQHRTQQLEKGQTHLQSVLSEQNIFMENIREEMRALTTTIKGIGVIGKRDVFITEEFQIMAIENTTNKLDAIVDQIDKKRRVIH